MVTKKKSLLDKVKSVFKKDDQTTDQVTEKRKPQVGSFSEMLNERRENAKRKMQKLNEGKD